MTKKSEMAEWILDFFRRAKVDAGQIIMFRTVQHKMYELNPKERDLFVPVANELIANGYFTYEEGTPQCLRLTEKGRNYIYDSSAQLDCCYDLRKPVRKDYMDVIDIGLEIQKVADWMENSEDDVQNLVSRICKVIIAVDDDELLNRIDCYVLVLAERMQARLPLSLDSTVQQALNAAVNHLIMLGKTEAAAHLHQFTEIG